jgi:arabinofuranosyltransferase
MTERRSAGRRSAPIDATRPIRLITARSLWLSTAATLAAFGVLFYFNAYVCDDAFITFRSVDNFVRGAGLRWNVGERVQVFTSPLHTLSLAGLYLFVHDPSDVPNPDRIYWLALFLSFALSAAALIRLIWTYRGHPSYWALFAILMSSQAFVTFSSSGLETPLIYFILVMYGATLLRPNGLVSSRDCFLFFLWVGLGLLTRLDLLLLFLPGVIYALVRGAQLLGRRVIVPVLAGLAPWVLWHFVSLAYFGFLLPNSYYAKLGLDAPRSVLAAMGLGYLGESFSQDPITLFVCGLAIALGWSCLRASLLCVGVVLHLVYVVMIGGDFLGFRFLAPPFLLSALVVCEWARRGIVGRWDPWWRVVVLGALVYGIVVPSSPLRAFRDPPAARDVAIYYPASGLARWSPGSRFPFGRFLFVSGPDGCRRLRALEASVAVWGDGLNGFCRGQHSHLIDPHGVTDPLIARLSLPIPGPFKPGHLAKPVPNGYVESMLEGGNRIADRDLAEYYDELRRIISGPLWTRERWTAIWRMNFTSASRYRKPYLALERIPGWMRENAGALRR